MLLVFLMKPQQINAPKERKLLAAIQGVLAEAEEPELSMDFSWTPSVRVSDAQRNGVCGKVIGHVSQHPKLDVQYSQRKAATTAMYREKKALLLYPEWEV